MSSQSNDSGQGALALVRAPQKLVAGLFLVGLCAFVLWSVADLSIGTVKFMGPAMLPRALATILGVSGAILIVSSFLHDGEPLARWSLRGPTLVVSGIILFSLTIRPLGLAVAAPLALIVSGFATTEARPREVVVFAAAITLCCIVLFRYLLDLAVPVLIVPGTSMRL